LVLLSAITYVQDKITKPVCIGIVLNMELKWSKNGAAKY